MDLKDTLQNALNGIASNAGANTVIGEPISTANGTTIIPVSKVMLGNVSGGLDGADEKAESKAPKNKFIGGGGSGVTVSPVAFLIVAPDGNVELLSINQNPAPSDPVSSVAGLIERSPDLVERFREVFSKDKGKEN